MSGELNEEQKAKFKQHIEQKASLLGKCPLCSHRSWTLLNHFLDVHIHHGDGNFRIGGDTYPHVGLMCTNCGNTQLVNAIFAGLISNDSSGSKPEGEQ